MLIRFSNRVFNSLVIGGALLLGSFFFYYVLYPSFASINAFVEVGDMQHEYTTGEKAFVSCVVLNTGHRPSYFLVLGSLISTNTSTFLPEKIYYLAPGQKQKFYYELQFSSAIPSGNYILHVRLKAKRSDKQTQSLASVKRVFRLLPPQPGKGKSLREAPAPVPVPAVARGTAAQPSLRTQEQPVTWVNIPHSEPPFASMLRRIRAYFASLTHAPAKTAPSARGRQSKSSLLRETISRMGVTYADSIKIISASVIPAPANRPVVRNVIPKRQYGFKEQISGKMRRLSLSLKTLMDDIIPCPPEDLDSRPMPLKPSTLKKMVSTESRIFCVSLKNGILSLFPDKSPVPSAPPALPRVLTAVPVVRKPIVHPVTLSFPETSVPAAGKLIVPVFGPGARAKKKPPVPGVDGQVASLLPAPKTVFPYVRAQEPKTVQPVKKAPASPASPVKTVKQPVIKPVEQTVVKKAPVIESAVKAKPLPVVPAPAARQPKTQKESTPVPVAAAAKPVPIPAPPAPVPAPRQKKEKAVKKAVVSGPAVPAPAPEPAVKSGKKQPVTAQPALSLEPVIPAARTIDIQTASAPVAAQPAAVPEAVQAVASVTQAVDISTVAAASSPAAAAAAEEKKKKKRKKKEKTAVSVSAGPVVQPSEPAPAQKEAKEQPPAPEIRMTNREQARKSISLRDENALASLAAKLTAYARFVQGVAVQETVEKPAAPKSPEAAIEQNAAVPVMPRIAGVPVAKITVEQKAALAPDKAVAVLHPSKVKKIQESSQTVGKIRNVSLPKSFERGTTAYIDVTVANVSGFDGYFTIVVNIIKSTSTVASLYKDLKLSANENRTEQIPYLVPRVRVSGTYSVAVDLVVRRTVDHTSGKKLQYTLFDKPPLITFLRMEPVKQGELMVDFLANVASDVDVKEVFFMYYPKSEKKEKYFPMQLVSGDRTNGVWSYKLPIPMQTRKPCFAFVAIDENDQKTKTPEHTLAGD